MCATAIQLFAAYILALKPLAESHKTFMRQLCINVFSW